MYRPGACRSDGKIYPQSGEKDQIRIEGCTDNALYIEGNRVFTHTYQSGDVDGRPTGKPIMVAEIER